MFNFIKQKLQKIYNNFTSKISALFGRTTIDEATLKELEVTLLSADTGVHTTRTIINQLKSLAQNGRLPEGQNLRDALRTALMNILHKTDAIKLDKTQIYVLVGINGSGKTTFAGKLAHQLTKEGKKVLLVAADTFRAAAPEQLHAWAQKIGVDIVLGNPNQDPASVVFTGCEKFKQESYDALVIDTAGRLHTKTNLMNELAKIKRIITKQLPNQQVTTLLTIDSMLGQNSFEQAKLFKECTTIDGIVLTKMDGTGKGGIVFAICDQLHIPIAYITFGEQLDQIKLFDTSNYVNELLDIN
jgi:fused signal recognition particle receptor